MNKPKCERCGDQLRFYVGHSCTDLDPPAAYCDNDECPACGLELGDEAPGVGAWWEWLRGEHRH